MNPFLRRARAIAWKEWQNLRREPLTLIVCFVEPIFTLLLYGFFLNFDLRNLPYAVWDQDRSEPARQLVRRLDSIGGTDPTFERWQEPVTRPEDMERLLNRGDVRFVLVIPRGFGRDVAAGRLAQVQAFIDAADSNTAGVAAGYLGSAVAAHNATLSVQEVARRRGAHAWASGSAPGIGGGNPAFEPIDLRWRVFFNPDLSSQRFIVPGLIAVLLSILAATLTSTSITRERELGTVESLLMTPVNATELVIGKMVPYLLIASINVGLVLLAGWLAFGLWPRGSLFMLAVFTLLFLPAMLALGMVISAGAPTQQFALVLATLTGFLPTLFLTGFAFPRSNMPWLVEQFSWLLPATHYIIATRALFLKGTGWSILWPHALWLIGLSTGMVTLAVVAARKRLSRGLE